MSPALQPHAQAVGFIDVYRYRIQSNMGAIEKRCKAKSLFTSMLDTEYSS